MPSKSRSTESNEAAAERIAAVRLTRTPPLIATFAAAPTICPATIHHHDDNIDRYRFVIVNIINDNINQFVIISFVVCCTKQNLKLLAC